MIHTFKIFEFDAFIGFNTRYLFKLRLTWPTAYEKGIICEGAGPIFPPIYPGNGSLNLFRYIQAVEGANLIFRKLRLCEARPLGWEEYLALDISATPNCIYCCGLDSLIV